MSKTFTVGMAVIATDVNDRGAPPREWVVKKVGRKLVTAGPPDSEWQNVVYRIETGRSNDDWGNGHLRTPQEYADDQRRSEVKRLLFEHGIKIDWNASSIASPKLEAILRVMEEPSDAE